ncbi:MAG: hypothetical protein ACKVWR_10695 [Acidimicrobiales bacterium]
MSDADEDRFDALERGEFVAYPLHAWALEARIMARSLLVSEELPHTWEGGTLVVPSPHRAGAEAVLEHVLSAERTSLDPDRDKVAYEVAAWGFEDQEKVAAALDEAGVVYEFDSFGDLLVYADDEEAVDAVFDELDLGEDDEADADPLAVQNLLTRLFVAADRLARDSRDSAAVIALAEAADEVAAMATPFGFDQPSWAALAADSGEVKALLEAADSEDAEVQAGAAALRDRLRPLV